MPRSVGTWTAVQQTASGEREGGGGGQHAAGSRQWAENNGEGGEAEAAEERQRARAVQNKECGDVVWCGSFSPGAGGGSNFTR